MSYHEDHLRDLLEDLRAIDSLPHEIEDNGNVYQLIITRSESVWSVAYTSGNGTLLSVQAKDLIMATGQMYSDLIGKSLIIEN